jgi:hypothetical protein
MANCKNNTTKLRELLLKAQSLPSAGSGEYNGPVAYTLSSVDELPTDAVEGSIAIVSNDDILGPWRLHTELLNLDAVEGFTFETQDDFGTSYEINEIYSELSETLYTLYYVTSEGHELLAYSTYTTPFWKDTTWRNIIITEIDNEEAEAWIRANGKKLSSLYVRKNSDWVLVEEYSTNDNPSVDLPNAEDYTF